MGEVWDSTQKFCADVWEEIKNCSVPTLDTNWGTGMLVVNILVPGCGTLVAGIKSERNTTMVIGVLQFILAFVLIGWIWSIYWGYLIYKKAQEGYIPSPV